MPSVKQNNVARDWGRKKEYGVVWKSRSVTDVEQKGFTLFEVIIAMLLLAMISTMIYSILNVSIRFSEKAEKSIVLMEREQGLIGLLQRQIRNGWYDEQKKDVVIIVADETTLRITTRAPLLYPQAGIVVAVYRYEPESESLYYLEKRDFYNVDYDPDYVPDYDEMQLLLTHCRSLWFSYEENRSAVTVTYEGNEYNFTPWCQNATRSDSI